MLGWLCKLATAACGGITRRVSNRMANKTQVTLVCDMIHKKETEAVATVPFAFDGYQYELDLCETDYAKMRGQVQNWSQHARSVNGQRLTRPKAKKPARSSNNGSAASKPEPSAVRAWAKNHGIKVSERGRIPAGVVEQYQADTAS